MTTLFDIQSAIRKLPPRERSELRQWLLTEGDEAVDVDTDAAELEAELLKVAEEPFSTYSREDIRSVCERVARELGRS